MLATTLDSFPPDDAPSWVDPINKPGLTGYDPEVLGYDGYLLTGRRVYPPGYHLCGQSKGMVDAMANSGLGYPLPSALVANGKYFMDEFNTFKSQAAMLPDGSDKTIRQTMVDVTEGFMMLMRAKETRILGTVGTRYWANLLFSTGSDEVATGASEINKQLFPIVPKFLDNLMILVNLRKTVVNNTISVYFSDDETGFSLTQYTEMQHRALSHSAGALMMLPQSGFTPEAANAWEAIYNLDWIDRSIGNTQYQFTPTLSYELQIGPVSKQPEPKNFYTCALALRMWEYMATIETPDGTKFPCTPPGAQLLSAFSDMFTYELQLEGSSGVSACNKPESWSTDIMATVISQIATAQSYAADDTGSTWTTLLNPEQTRLMTQYANEVACIHLGRINAFKSCTDRGTVYNSVPTTFVGDFTELEFPYQGGAGAYGDGVLGDTRKGIATVSEVCNVYAKNLKDICGLSTSNTCAYTSVDKVALLPGRNKCTNYEPLFHAFNGTDYEFLNSCAAYAGRVATYDPEYDNGCGFLLRWGSFGAAVNYMTTVRDICPETCSAVPEDC